jgi:hypothetical protein
LREYQLFATRVFGFSGLSGLISIRPGPDDPKAWYDRAIWVVGGGLILLLIVSGVVAVILEKAGQ